MTTSSATISFFQDTDHENPVTECDWDGLTFYYGHRRYDLGGKRFRSKKERDIILKEAENNFDYIFHVYMYDHSGCTVSLNPFPCPWDSGVVGFIVISEGSVEDYEDARKYAKGFVADLDTWLRGEVWGYMIKDGEEDIIDSCGGFFGDDIRTNGILEYIDEEYHSLAIEEWEYR